MWCGDLGVHVVCVSLSVYDVVRAISLSEDALLHLCVCVLFVCVCVCVCSRARA